MHAIENGSHESLKPHILTAKNAEVVYDRAYVEQGSQTKLCRFLKFERNAPSSSKG